ncbi:MFS transporter [Methanospirillum hungatei]|uniref:MFS transporter n=1 Tax=Methanospirillum hungatei TaxID=2203 RepID=UPI0026F2664C|nr:MFS transporter [Methanospirillum hungatei]
MHTSFSHIRDRLIIAVITLRFIMGGIDSSILPLGISSIAWDFGGDYASFLFLIEGVIFASALIFSGRLGDQVGLKQVFLAGVLLFTAGSLVSAFAPGIEWLMIVKAFSSLGLTISLAVSVPILMVFIRKEHQGRAIGYTVMGTSIGTIIGPVICGLILQSFGWRSMYFLLLPFGLIILIAGIYSIPQGPCRTIRISYDLPGFFLIFLTLGVFCIGMNLGLIEQNPLIFAQGLIITILAGAGFILWERRAEEPLLDLSFVFQKKVIIPLIIAFSIYAVYRISNYFIPIYLSEIQKIPPVMIGLITSIGAVIPAIISPLCGIYIERKGIFGTVQLIILSAVSGILSSLCMIIIPWTGWLCGVYISLFFLGLMFALGWTAAYSYYYAHITLDKAGVAGGIFETIAELAGLLSISMVQISFAAGVLISTGGTISARDIIWESIPGVQTIYLVSLLVCILILLLGMNAKRRNRTGLDQNGV